MGDLYKRAFQGLELRGTFGDLKTARRAENVVVDDDFSAHLRPPLVPDGSLNSPYQGLCYLDGEWFTFAPVGTAGATGITGVSALLFDEPEYTDPSGWSLAQALVFAGRVHAWIWHTEKVSGVVGSQQHLRLHVWDDRPDKPTYVEDVGSWIHWRKIPTMSVRPRPQEVWEPLSGYLTGPTDFTPQMDKAAQKLWVSLPDGNVRCSAIGTARVWTDRSWDEIADQGEHWYFWTTGLDVTGGIYEFVVSEDHDLLNDLRKWAGYELERWDESASEWQVLTEVSVAPTADGEYQVSAVTSRFGSGNEIKVAVYCGKQRLLRWRMVAGGPPVQLLAGGTLWQHDEVVAIGPVADVDRVESDVPWRMVSGAGMIGGIDEPVWVEEVDDTANNRPLLMEGQHYTLERREHSDGIDRANLTWVVYTETATAGQTVFETFIIYSWWDHDVLVNGIKNTDNTISLRPATNFADITFDTGRSAGEIVTVRYRGRSEYTARFRVLAACLGVSRVRYREQFLEIDPVMFSSTDGYVMGTTKDKEYVARIRADNGNAAVEWNPVDEMPLAGADRMRSLVVARFTILVENNRVDDWVSYRYGNHASDESDWYIARKLAYVDGSGSMQAGTKATAHYEPNGEQVSALRAVKNRLVVAYHSSMQMWALDPLLINDQRLDGLDHGVIGPLVPMNKMLVGLTSAGFHAWQPSGLNFDSIADSAIAEQLEGIGVITPQAAAWWPARGLYVCAALLTPSTKAQGWGWQSGLHFFVLRFAPQKFMAWTVWRSSLVTSVDEMVMAGTDLFVISGSQRLHFPNTVGASAWEDDGDIYQAHILTPQDHLGLPGRLKELDRIWLDVEGYTRVGLRMLVEDADAEQAMLRVEGSLYGAPAYDLDLEAEVLALDITSEREAADEEWHLHGVQVARRAAGW